MSKESIFYIGQRVYIKCPVYKNGRTFTGIITGKKISVSSNCYFVMIDGNKKSTALNVKWLTIKQ